MVPPFIGKRSIEEHHDGEMESTDNEIQKRQVIPIDDLDVIQPYPLPGGYCTCCAVTACDAPMKLNRFACRCECPRGTRKNARGQCVGE